MGHYASHTITLAQRAESILILGGAMSIPKARVRQHKRVHVCVWMCTNGMYVYICGHVFVCFVSLFLPPLRAMPR